MNKMCAALVTCCSLLWGTALAQSNAFPPAALAGKTIAIVNETHAEAVSDGARAALADWGQFKLIDDADAADVTLRFDKSTDHAGQDSHKTDANGNPTDYSYSMSFTSKIHMKAYTRDGLAPFYTTTTDDSKKKAGLSCVIAFHEAFRAAHSR